MLWMIDWKRIDYHSTLGLLLFLLVFIVRQLVGVHLKHIQLFRLFLFVGVFFLATTLLLRGFLCLFEDLVFVFVLLQRLFCDLLDFLLILQLVFSEDATGGGIGRGKGIGVCQEGPDGSQHRPDIVDGAPLLLKHCMISPVLSRQMRPSL